jgi:hypothetical protein
MAGLAGASVPLHRHGRRSAIMHGEAGVASAAGWPGVPLLLLAVKQHPHGKILRDIFEAMRDMRSAEQHVARTNRSYHVLNSITAGSGSDEIEFVALMWNLRPIGGARGEPDFEFTVNEHF